MPVSLFVFCRSDHLYHILDSTYGGYLWYLSRAFLNSLVGWGQGEESGRGPSCLLKPTLLNLPQSLSLPIPLFSFFFFFALWKTLYLKKASHRPGENIYNTYYLRKDLYQGCTNSSSNSAIKRRTTPWKKIGKRFEHSKTPECQMHSWIYAQ